MGELWCALLPTSLTSVNKKTHLEISRLCGLTGNDERCQYVEGGIIGSGKKKSVLIFHTIKLDWNSTYFMEEVNLFDTKERQPFWEIPFFLGFFPSYLLFMLLQVGRQQLPWFCSQFGKNVKLFFYPQFFFQINQYCINNNYPTLATEFPSSPDTVAGDITNTLGA